MDDYECIWFWDEVPALNVGDKITINGQLYEMAEITIKLND